MRTGAIAIFGWIVITVMPLHAQTLRTVSHQGLLTDASGIPVSDGSKKMTFKIYDVESGGAALWTETQDVITENGLFHVILGSVKPLTGFDFDQNLWLGIEIATDPEISPRTKLTGVPYAIGLAMPYQDTVRIQTMDLGTDGSERVNEDLTVYSGDAMLGLYSNAAGAVGSGIQMGEIIGGSFTDKWSMFRRTNSAGASMLLTYGDDPSYPLNPTMVEFDTAGSIHASAYEYPSPGSVRYLAVNATAFRPNGQFPTMEYTSANTGAYIDEVANELFAPIHLPQEALVDSLYCWVYDNSSLDLECGIIGSIGGLDGSLGGTAMTGSAVSSGTPGNALISTDLSFTQIDNRLMSFAVRVGTTSGSWSDEDFNLQVRQVVIRYRVFEAD